MTVYRRGTLDRLTYGAGSFDIRDISTTNPDIGAYLGYDGQTWVNKKPLVIDVVKDFDAPTDGSDATSAFNSAIDSVRNKDGLKVLYYIGRCSLGNSQEPVIIDDSEIIIKGAGYGGKVASWTPITYDYNASWIEQGHVNQPCFSLRRVNGGSLNKVEIRDLTFHPIDSRTRPIIESDDIGGAGYKAVNRLKIKNICIVDDKGADPSLEAEIHITNPDNNLSLIHI